MPATSKTQFRLFSQVHGVQKFKKSGGKDGLDPKELNPEYKKQIVDMADDMTQKDVKDMIDVDYDKLPEEIKENNAMATPASVNGMGDVALPGNPGTDETGSGDIAATSALTDEDEDEDEGKKIYKFLKFNAFVGK